MRKYKNYDRKYISYMHFLWLISYYFIFDRLRAAYGSNVLQNAVHGSSNPDHAKTTIQQIFGDLDFNADGTVKGI